MNGTMYELRHPDLLTFAQETRRSPSRLYLVDKVMSEVGCLTRRLALTPIDHLLDLGQRALVPLEKIRSHCYWFPLFKKESMILVALMNSNSLWL
jgi:hypothetical protein